MSLSFDNNNNEIAWRNGYKWSVNECLRLEREYDLLQLSVPEMAALHNRTNNAIIWKLHSEGLADYNQLYLQTFGNASIMNDFTDIIQPQFQADYSDVNNDDEDEDDDYVPKIFYHDDDDASDDDQERHGYLVDQVKTLQKQMDKLLSYFSTLKLNQTGSTI